MDLVPSSSLVKRIKEPLGVPSVKKGLRKYTKTNVITHCFSEAESDDLTSEVFFALCEAVNTPRSLAAWILYENKEFIQLLDLKIDYEPLFGSYRFAGDLLVSKFLSKYRDFPIDIDREGSAFEKWLAAEKACQTTNETFRLRWAGSLIWDHDVEQVYHLSRLLASRILGSEVPDDILSHGGFGPGADTGTSKNNISRFYKYQHTGSGTPALISLIADFVGDDRRDEFIHSMELTDSSRLTFVPKTATIDRAICIEPRWNIFYQLSVGRVIQVKLRKFGVDITDQTRNRDLAGRAFKERLATVDLSSASDRISKNLVLDMLPEAWADLLFKLRCPRTSYKGVSYKLEKVSSMGNGYTFPLETLIFHCVAKSACAFLNICDDNVSVYGDDIIVPQEAFPLLVKTLEHLGFAINHSKSFSRGRFFESCGADFFDGVNVRPIFLKGKIQNVQGAIRLANQLVEYGRRCNNYDSFDNRYSAARQAVLDRTPKFLRLFGPINAGDTVFHAPFDSCSPPRAGNGWEGYRIRGFVSMSRCYSAHDDSLIFAKLDGGDAPGNFITKRDSTFTVIKKILVSRYEDYLVSD